MAVKGHISEDGSTFSVEIDNGDLAALKQSIEKWNLKDLEAALKFSLGILRFAPDGKVFINQSGNYVQLVPSPDALKSDTPNGESSPK